MTRRCARDIGGTAGTGETVSALSSFSDGRAFDLLPKRWCRIGPGLRDNRTKSLLARRHPVAGLALGGGDLDLGHQLGDLAAHPDGVSAAFDGCEIEPFMRGNQVDDAGTAACPVEPTLEQHIRDRACFHRRGVIQIEKPLKHLFIPFLFFLAGPVPSAAPVQL